MAVGVYSGVFTKQNTTGNQDITLPSGCPDLTGAATGTWALMVWTVGSTAASGALDVTLYGNIGYATSSSNQYCIGMMDEDGVATSDSATVVNNNLISLINIISSLSTTASFVSFPTSTTMRINWTSNATSAHNSIVFSYVIITGLSNAKVVQWASPTTATSTAVTGVGFQPDLLLHAVSGNSEALGTVGLNTRYAFGCMNSEGDEWSIVGVSYDGQGTSVAARYRSTTDGISSCNSTAAADMLASLTSMDSDGFTVNFSSVYNSQANKMVTLALKGVESNIGSVSLTATSSQDVSSSHGFAIKGIIAGNVSSGTGTNAAVTSLGAVGGTSLNQDSSQCWGSDDGEATTSVGVAYYSTMSAFTSFGASIAPAITEVTLSSASINSFTISNSASAAAGPLHYILIGQSVNGYQMII